jgi:hypothetical protein
MCRCALLAFSLSENFSPRSGPHVLPSYSMLRSAHSRTQFLQFRHLRGHRGDSGLKSGQLAIEGTHSDSPTIGAYFQTFGRRKQGGNVNFWRACGFSIFPQHRDLEAKAWLAHGLTQADAQCSAIRKTAPAGGAEHRRRPHDLAGGTDQKCNQSYQPDRSDEPKGDAKRRRKSEHRQTGIQVSQMKIAAADNVYRTTPLPGSEVSRRRTRLRT